MIRSLQSSLLLLLLTALLATGCGPDEEEPYTPPDGDGPWILVDLYHTRLQNPEDHWLYKGNYDYQGVFGYRRLFNHLEEQGYNWTSIRTMELTEARLDGFDTLFINLVHTERPDFTNEEVEAIKAFVHGGGGLVVIVDHTNVYRHAERVNRFLEPMGIHAMYHTAVDQAPRYSVAGGGWVMAFDFADHPVTEGLDMMCIQTGGALRTEAGVAFTSEHSFADFWNEEDTSGFYGDWRQGPDHELEPSGPLAIVAAAEYGEGRVVVVADQNIFGDAWLHFGNNFELALNAFEWTSRREDSEPRLRDTRPAGFNLAVDVKHNDYNTGRTAADGYYTFFVHLNRDTDVTARGTTRLADHHDALVLLSPTIDFDADAVQTVRAYLEAGKRVVLTFEARSIPSATARLLEQLAPDFSLSNGTDTVRLDPDGSAALRSMTFDRIDGRLALQSDRLAVDGITLATFDSAPDPQNTSNPPQGYLLDVTSEWGEPFLRAAHGDRTIDIARAGVVGNGELIIFIQDGFWRNRTMGSKETVRPNAHNMPSVELQYRLLDYLKTPGD